VEVLTIRPVNDERRTYLLRLHNVTDQGVTAHLLFPAVSLEDAYLGTVSGERRAAADWSSHEASVPMKHYDVKTLVIKVKVPHD